MNLRNIMSMSEIMAMLREQAELRAQENDEAGILLKAADAINEAWLALEEYGQIRVERWPEGLVLWVGGEIKWKSWKNKKRAELASRPPQKEVNEATVADLDAECERYECERVARATGYLEGQSQEFVTLYRALAAMQFWRAKAKGRPLP